MKKNFLTATVTIVMIGVLVSSLAACNKARAGANEETSAISSTAGVRNPFEDVSSLKDACQAAGFEMSIPDAPEGYKTVSYRVNADASMIEVIYSDKNMEEKDRTEAYRIRKAVGNEDISGDYNHYSEIAEVQEGDNTITLKGNDGKVFLAVWTSGDYTYAIDIDMNDSGMSQKEVIDLANATK